MTQGLESVKGYIRKQLSKTLKLRKVPELEFYYDEVFEHGMHMENLLKSIKNG
jgi:ribosome-binding factor A